MSKKAKVIGVNMIPFKKPGLQESYPVMAAKAVKGALEDAGIDYSEIQQARPPASLPLPHGSPLTGVPYWSAIRGGFMGLWRTRCAFNCAVTATSTSANRVCK